MESLLDEILDCLFQNGKRVLILILNNLIILRILLIFPFCFLILGFFKEMLPLLLNFQYLLGGLEDALLNFLDLVKLLPLLHAILPSKGLRVDIIGPQEDIEIPQGERSPGLIIDHDIPYLLVRNLHLIFFTHLFYYKLSHISARSSIIINKWRKLIGYSLIIYPKL